MRSARVEQRIKAVDVFLLSLSKQVHALVKENLPEKSSVRVLEAGCGSTGQIGVDPEWHVTGIDISEQQLSRNTFLQERILGDIETYRLQEESFDLIICWDVLEHLPNPERALQNLFKAVSAEGLVVLAFPHVLSIKGLVTKFTPFSVANFFYRHIIGDKRDASELNQFPTHMRLDILPGRIVALAEKQGLEVCYRYLYEGPVQRYLRAVSRVADAGFAVTGFLLKTATLGFFEPNLTDCILILRKLPPDH
ncbi:MAG: methyltransferase domain-containing protein [Candidatus Hydrogenedentota bacterium]